VAVAVGGRLVAVGGIDTDVGVSVGAVVGVSVGGTLSVAVGSRVGLQVAVGVTEGRGVLVGVGVTVGDGARMDRSGQVQPAVTAATNSAGASAIPRRPTRLLMLLGQATRASPIRETGTVGSGLLSGTYALPRLA
jgi:hypothetical protein